MRRKAFTLLEIILVVVILGVLSGLALPRFMRFMEIQKARKAAGDLRLIASAAGYFQQNRISLPSTLDDFAAINAAFELEIRNSDYTGTFSYSDSTWSIVATRDSKHTLKILNTAPRTVVCENIGSSTDCSFISAYLD